MAAAINQLREQFEALGQFVRPYFNVSTTRDIFLALRVFEDLEIANIHPKHTIVRLEFALAK